MSNRLKDKTVMLSAAGPGIGRASALIGEWQRQVKVGDVLREAVDILG